MTGGDWGAPSPDQATPSSEAQPLTAFSGLSRHMKDSGPLPGLGLSLGKGPPMSSSCGESRAEQREFANRSQAAETSGSPAPRRGRVGQGGNRRCCRARRGPTGPAGQLLWAGSSCFFGAHSWGCV